MLRDSHVDRGRPDVFDHANELNLAIVLSRAKGAEDLVLGRIPACGRDGDAGWLGGRCRPGVVPDVPKVAHGGSLLCCAVRLPAYEAIGCLVVRDLGVAEASASPLLPVTLGATAGQNTDSPDLGSHRLLL